MAETHGGAETHEAARRHANELRRMIRAHAGAFYSGPPSLAPLGIGDERGALEAGAKALDALSASSHEAYLLHARLVHYLDGQFGLALRPEHSRAIKAMLLERLEPIGPVSGDRSQPIALSASSARVAALEKVVAHALSGLDSLLDSGDHAMPDYLWREIDAIRDDIRTEGAALREREPADLVALVQEWQQALGEFGGAHGDKDNAAAQQWIWSVEDRLIAWTPAAAPPPAETGGAECFECGRLKCDCGRFERGC